MADETAVVDAPVSPTVVTTPSVDWQAHVPQEYAATFKPYEGKSLADVFKGYGEAAKLIGSRPQGIKVPGADAKPEEVSAFRKALGVPDKPEEYQFTRPEVAASQGMWDDGAEKAFLADAHKAGLTQPQVQAIVGWYGNYLASIANGNQREAQAVMQELRREWGPNYDAKLGRANRAIQQYGGDGLIDLFAGNGMARHPLVVKAFAAIADDLVEHGAMEHGGHTNVSAADAASKLTELRAELNKLPDGHPRRSELVDQIIALTRVKAA